MSGRTSLAAEVATVFVSHERPAHDPTEPGDIGRSAWLKQFKGPPRRRRRRSDLGVVRGHDGRAWGPAPRAGAGRCRRDQAGVAEKTTCYFNLPPEVGRT
ncbi:hypothetical protein GCM10009530_11910 [Microbispora corallina]|uniref:Uncharacterized protein n=1 Tax=Microbispora corallina TaxID=83302 RepID=A0ABQ4FTF6_9ACTN|nr:hypothetical protein Mco01_11120 [Microbispora corallina]